MKMKRDGVISTEKIFPWVICGDRDERLNNGVPFSEDVPMIAFVGELRIVFVIEVGGSYFVLKEHEIPKGMSVEELYQTSCKNMAQEIEFVIGNTMYGGFAIMADGIHEGSSLCFKHIWEVCGEKLEDDLLICYPSRDTVVFAPLSNQQAVEGVLEHCKRAYFHSKEKISEQKMLFHYEKKRTASL